MALYLALGAHISLGLAIAVYFLTAGLPFAKFFTQKGVRTGQVNDALVFAYPVGLGLLSISAILGTLLSVIIAWAFLIITAIAAAVQIIREPELRRLFLRGALTILTTLPAVATLGIIFGFWRHGPTSAIGSATYGDTIYYVARFEALVATGRLDQNLMVEGSNYIFNPFLEQGPVLVAYLFRSMPLYDPFMFFASTMPSVTLCWTALCFAALCPSQRSLGFILRVVLAAACVATLGHYVGWEIESPGVGWSLVMIFPVALLTIDTKHGVGWLVAALGIGLLLFFYKVFAAPVVALILIVPGIETLAKTIPPFARLWVAVFVAFTVGSLALLFWPAIEIVFGYPMITLDKITGTPAGWYVISGIVAPLVVLPPRRAIGLSLAAASSWLVPAYFHQAASMAIGVFAVEVLLASTISYLSLLTVGLVAIVGHHSYVLHGREEAIFALKWSALMFSSLTAVTSRWIAAAALMGVVTIGAAGRVFIKVAHKATLESAAHRSSRIYFDFMKLPEPATLDASDRALWLAVRDKVPSDGLIFTSFTGPEPGLRTGWNYYCAIAHRQFYLSGWYTDALRLQQDLLKEKLRLNDSVLSGDHTPRDVRLSKRYSGYYAVVGSDRVVPPNFDLLASAANGRIYKIPE